MADQIAVTDVDSAALAIEAMLNGPGTGEQPKQPDPAPAQAAAPEPEPNSSQADAETQSDSDNQTASDAEAPAVQTAAPEVKEPARQPASSPELDQMRAKAAQTIQEAESARTQFLNQLNTYIPQLESALRGEFADIKTPEDVIKLMETDVGRYNRFQTQQTRLAYANQARNQAMQVEQTQQNERLTQWRQAEGEKIGSLIPELKDPDKGPALARKLNEFALKSGYTAEQLSRASAADFKMLHRAMQADELEAGIAAAKQKAAKAPPVQEPGARQTNSSKDQKLQDAYARLQKTGDLQDAALLFSQF